MSSADGYMEGSEIATLEAFINTVTDIKIYFQTYSYSGL